MIGSNTSQTREIRVIITKEVICSLYQTFYRYKYGNNKYKFLPTEKAEKAIEMFFVLLKKHYDLHAIGANFIIEYFLFQFDRVEHLVFNRFGTKKDNVLTAAGKIQIHDIVGKKAFEYWLKRNVKFDYVIRQSFFALKHRINFIQLIKELRKEPVEILPISEEIEKKRFHNLPGGFANCIERTTLFNHLSQLCIICDIKKDCKQLLKQNYPLIYLQRNYN